MNDAMRQKCQTVEGLLSSLYKAPVKKRHAAMLAAARVLANKPDALLCSQADAGRLLSVSRFSIWRMAREGQIQSVNIRGSVRYRVSDLEKLAADGTPQPAATQPTTADLQVEA